jgi:UDP-N-acetylglucosamine 2-epimerase (non-hydrolysing)
MRICDAVREILLRHPCAQAWIPMHPHPAVRRVWSERLGGHERALLGEPLGYTAFVRALEGASLVLTDSGGIQEECAALGKPVLVMREHTERPEAVDAGVARLVGDRRRSDRRSSFIAPRRSGRREAMARSTDAFGDGRASQRILAALSSAARPR